MATFILTARYRASVCRTTGRENDAVVSLRSPVVWFGPGPLVFGRWAIVRHFIALLLLFDLPGAAENSCAQGGKAAHGFTWHDRGRRVGHIRRQNHCYRHGGGSENSERCGCDRCDWHDGVSRTDRFRELSRPY